MCLHKRVECHHNCIKLSYICVVSIFSPAAAFFSFVSIVCLFPSINDNLVIYFHTKYWLTNHDCRVETLLHTHTRSLNSEQFNCNENKRLFTFICAQACVLWFICLFEVGAQPINGNVNFVQHDGALRQKGPGNGFNAPVIKDFA